MSTGIWLSVRVFRAGLLGGLLVAVISCLIGTRLSADTRRNQRREAEELVREALSYEAYGRDGDRQQLLDRALQLAPDQPSAHWHKGEVRVGSQWLPAFGPIESPNETRLRESYERQRATAVDSVDGQLALADWCAKHHLRAQETAHLNRILELVPDHAAARERLEYERVDSSWVQRRNLWQGVRQNRQIDESLKTWQRTLDELLGSLRRKAPAQTERIVNRLKTELAPNAVPALEIILGNDSEAAALVGVQLLGHIQHHDAAASLARQAVLTPWPPVATAALDQLQNRPPDHYVPLWLAELSTPIESRIQAGLINGRMLYRHELTRETQTQRQSTLLETVMDRQRNQVRMPAGNNANTRIVRGTSMVLGLAPPEMLAMADAQTTAYARELERTRQNQRIEAMNDRLYQALTVATGQSLERTPQAWWSWWDSENGVAFNGGKQYDYRYFQDVRIYQDVRPLLQSAANGSSPSRVECFVAGTPVWTITGAVDIEKVRIGDLVLSQDLNTGELKFQPVLQTSQRPPERLVKICLATRYGDTLEGSGGHPLWVAGEGWVKLRDLTSGMVLHGVDGTTLVRDVEPGSTQETFNLVVDDFHTYIVGNRRLLCHDNTARRPTSAVVPGLVLH
ncbi:MAG: polymorphic toxin-type HINT domain-containing protein [Pirellulaceae bacterium]